MDMYKQVTEQIVAELEKGAAPWVKTWRADASADRNVISQKPYRGINRLLLGMASMGNGFASNEWATYKQWTEKGAQVQKGQHGSHIVFFKPIEGRKDVATGETESGYCILRGYTVFNAAQTDYVSPVPIVAAEFDASPVCDAFIAATGASITHGGDMAFFMPSQDRVQMPNASSFESPANYYATAFHELTHWTGAKSRLDRDQLGKFGNPAYAFEELIAELGAAFLCNDMHIQGELRHAGYIGHWLKACREDNKAIFRAAALAQKAADYLNAFSAVEQRIAA